MPQLDTSTWFITILSALITLFTIFQINLASFTNPQDPSIKTSKTSLSPSTWETKWTKIYLPHSSHLH
uniref:ATP synthase F0 subunit 8 n=1 Tax=Elephantulus myurus TaxID=113277 RepID=UPI00279BBB10|nr:ATP synthase F0 subunit 8 [Elephantulus myurus]WGO62107.1 ATP synthase F0 subunit 8 [Elephantulus myurus]